MEDRLSTCDCFIALFVGSFLFNFSFNSHPGYWREVNGSKRWIVIAGFSFQPSEFVKYIVPAYMIHRLLPLDASQMTLKEFLKLSGILSIPILLILIEPNNGTAGVIGLVVVVMCILTRISFRYWAFPI